MSSGEDSLDDDSRHKEREEHIARKGKKMKLIKVAITKSLNEL